MMSKKNVRHWKGDWSGKGLKVGIVVSDFNEYLTKQLLDGALDTLDRHQLANRSVHVVHVPGAFEIPLAAKKMIERFRPDAVVALAVVIRGKTKHFNQVVDQCAEGIRMLAMQSGVPVVLGMISAENEMDAVRRVGLKNMNKGREWALSAMEMASLSKKLAAPARGLKR